MTKLSALKRILVRSSVVTAVAVLALLIAFPVSMQLTGKSAESESALSKAFRLPVGGMTYNIAQAAEVWPKLTKAGINPVDVHVGQVQTIEVIVESRSKVDRVEAHVQTDKDTVVVPLDYVKDVTISSDKTDKFALVKLEGGLSWTDKARAEGTSKALYRGSWTVHDTHDTMYQTVIKAVAGTDTSDVTLAWSDACGIPPGGDWTLSSPCTISGDDGVDNGSATINSSLTINATFSFNSGRSFTIGSGSVAICSGCEIRTADIYQLDADGDGFPGNFNSYPYQPNGAYRRRYLMSTTADCNDSSYSASNSCAAPSCWPDADGDGYYSTTATTGCSGSYSSSQGNDCYDANSQAHPGQQDYFQSNRGDGSYDYDCSGGEEQAPQEYTGISNYGTCETRYSGGFPGWCDANNLPAYADGNYYGCGSTRNVIGECKDQSQGSTWAICDSGYQQATVICH